MSKFNPARYIIKVQGKDYLKPVHRVMWMRSEHPYWGIDSFPLEIGATVCVKCELRDNDGYLIASGLATVRQASAKEKTWAGRDFEKAETAAVGRCMSHAGYGTEYSGDEMDDKDYLSDSPIEQSGTEPPPSPRKQNAPREEKEVVEAGTRRQVTLCNVFSKVVNNSTLHILMTETGERVGVWSRKDFIKLGYIAESDWEVLEQEQQLDPKIPTTIEMLDNGYWDVDYKVTPEFNPEFEALR